MLWLQTSTQHTLYGKKMMLRKQEKAEFSKVFGAKLKLKEQGEWLKWDTNLQPKQIPAMEMSSFRPRVMFETSFLEMMLLGKQPQQWAGEAPTPLAHISHLI